jgi:hypothetical protein
MGYGEMELHITSQGISHRIATGQGISTDAIPLSKARELTTREAAAFFKPGEGTLGAKGIQVGDQGISLLLKIAIPGDRTQRATLCGMPYEQLAGRTQLFAPAQLAAGLFTLYTREVERTFWLGCLPLLAYGGKAPRPSRP